MATANICNTFCGAQKLPQIFALFFAKRKKYRYKYRKINWKKIMATANICDISCKAQKLPQIFAVFFAKRKQYR